ncbi:3-deoxy-7-phosphoheptulonate synthase [Streptomyces sp. NPDC002537]
MGRWFTLPVAQQPEWGDPWLLEKVRKDLTALTPLVDAASVTRLRSLLARVATGRMRMVQAGDCAEDPAACGREDVRAKAGMLDVLADVMRVNSGMPVLRVGRMAGQLAKPRSQPTERIGDVELPAYRGPLVNAPEFEAAARAADPLRMIAGYRLSRTVLAHLDGLGRGAGAPDTDAVWTSHEALLLDYELPLLRRTEPGELFLTSTHLPWIGERTRRLDGAHVRLLAAVANPVACKVGPTMTAGELLRLCEVLDPLREPGRLTLVSRIGADGVHDVLPGLVRAVRAAGHPVIWLCDPVHGNTVRAANGRKTRVVASVVRELEGFQDSVLAEGGLAGGVHLEATPDPVAECVWTADQQPGEPYTTLCDPRLNLTQAVDVVSAWRA